MADNPMELTIAVVDRMKHADMCLYHQQWTFNGNEVEDEDLGERISFGSSSRSWSVGVRGQSILYEYSR